MAPTIASFVFAFLVRYATWNKNRLIAANILIYLLLAGFMYVMETITEYNGWVFGLVLPLTMIA